ncbi:MAG: OPT/YSL family transporter, partial [Candidatus Sericytochromatia bacterium]
MGAPEPTPSEEPLLAADLAIKLRELPPEEREAYWHAHVYRGNAKQLTVRAILMGMLLGGVLSLANLYLGLKLGLTVGMAITAGVLAFAFFKIFERILPGGEFTDLENNAMQSVASAAGFMASAGLISAVPALLLMTGEHMNPLMLAFWISAISLLGVVVAIPVKRQLINNDQLPFPSGTAAAATIQGLHGEGKTAIARAKALGLGGLVSGIAAWLHEGGADILTKLSEKASWLKALAFSLPNSWAPIETFKGLAASKLTLSMSGSLTLYATGALVGPRVGIGLLVGAVLNWMFLVPYLLENKMVEGSVYNWTRWPAVAMLIIITLVALGMQWKSIARAFGSILGSFGAASTPESERAAAIEVPGKWFLIGLAVAGSACVVLANM